MIDKPSENIMESKKSYWIKFTMFLTEFNCISGVHVISYFDLAFNFNFLIIITRNIQILDEFGSYKIGNISV